VGAECETRFFSSKVVAVKFEVPSFPPRPFDLLIICVVINSLIEYFNAVIVLFMRIYVLNLDLYN